MTSHLFCHIVKETISTKNQQISSWLRKAFFYIGLSSIIGIFMPGRMGKVTYIDMFQSYNFKNNSDASILREQFLSWNRSVNYTVRKENFTETNVPKSRRWIIKHCEIAKGCLKNISSVLKVSSSNYQNKNARFYECCHNLS